MEFAAVGRDVVPARQAPPCAAPPIRGDVDGCCLSDAAVDGLEGVAGFARVRVARGDAGVTPISD